MKENINRFQVFDYFFFPPPASAVAYFRFFSVLMDFKLEELLGGWVFPLFFLFFFPLRIIIDMALWHPY